MKSLDADNSQIEELKESLERYFKTAIMTKELKNVVVSKQLTLFLYYYISYEKIPTQTKLY